MKKMAALLLAILMLTGCMEAFAEDAGTQKLNTYYNLAIGYIAREDYDKAMKHLDAALEICTPEYDAALYSDLHLKKGCVYTLRQEYDAALAELDEAIRVSPELSEAYLVKVQVYSETGNVAQAAVNLEKYIALSGDTSMNETLAQMYLQLENNAKADESYRQLAESISGDPTLVAYNQALYEINAGMYAEALANLQTCTDDHEKYPALHYNMGVCNMMLNNYEAAAEQFTASIEREDFHLDAVYNRAICNMTLQQFEPAIADFTEYIETRKATATASAEETTEEATEEATEETTEETAEDAAEEPTEETTEEAIEETTEETAEDAAEEPTEETTEEATEETVTAESEPDIAYYYRGVCYLSIAMYEEAIADFTICVENGISENESLLNRGLSYLQCEKFEEAKADFTVCIEADFMTDDALFYRAYAYLYLGENEEALADLNICIEHSYNLANSYQLRAQVYQLLGDDDNYLADLEASLDYMGE